jgi:PKD repeat protein
MGSILILSVLSIALVLADNGCAAAAPPQEVWNKTYEGAGHERAELVLQIDDGGYFTTGRTSTSTTNVWFVKTDPNGNEEWNGTFGKTGTDRVDHILQTPDGGYIVAGTTQSWLYGIERSEFWVVKIDRNGDEQWNRTYGEGVIEWETFVNQTLDGGYLLGVTTSTCDACPGNILLAKINPDGTEQWNRTFGGYEDDRLMYADQTSDGTFVIVRINRTLPDYDKWIDKIDASGTVQWSKSLGEGYVSQVQRTSNGGYIIAARDTYYTSNSDLMLIKTDSKGNEQWNKTFIGTMSWSVNSIRQTWDGGYIMGGNIGSDHSNIWVMKTDPQGEEQWDWTLTDMFHNRMDSVHQTTDGGFIAGWRKLGSTYALTKFDPDGNLQWNKEYHNLRYFQPTSDGGYVLAGDKDDDFLLIKIREEPVPAALFSYNPLYPGVDQTIAFDATPSFYPGGNITVYQWDFGDGNITTTTEGTITHSYTLDGNYSVNLTVLGNDNLVNSTTKEVIVQKTAPPDVEWMRTFGGNGYESANWVMQTSDSGYIVAGNTESYGAGKYDIWVVKTDQNGTEQWNRTYGGTDYDSGDSIQQTSDGDYIIAGATRGLYSTGLDFWLVKVHPNGDEQWNKTFGGTDSEYANFVHQTRDGGYILGGYKVNSSGISVYWLVKTDPSGTEEWNRTFRGECFDSRFDSLYSFQQTFDGGYILAGTTYDHSVERPNLWLIKTDSGGNEQWNRTLGGIEIFWVKAVMESSDGSFIIIGETDPFNIDNPVRIMLVKANANGYEEWNRTFTGIDYYIPSSLLQTSDGGYIIAGIKNSDAWLVKTDSKGNIQWYNGLGGTGRDNVNFIRQTSDGGYIFTGMTSSYNRGNMMDLWLVKVAGMEVDFVQPRVSANYTIIEEVRETPEKPIPGFGLWAAVVSVVFVLFWKRKTPCDEVDFK